MDPERARELLAAERARIKSALSRLGHQDSGELSDEQDPASQASDLYQALWNRPISAPLDVTGDPAILALFLDRVHVTWT